MDDDCYWSVTMDVFAFETKDDAVKFREALTDAFCAMPEAKDYGASFATRIVRESRPASPTTEGE